MAKAKDKYDVYHESDLRRFGAALTKILQNKTGRIVPDPNAKESFPLANSHLPRKTS